MSDLYINKYIWDKKLINNFYKSCNELFTIDNLQLYNPIYSLYFHIYNTKNSHKCIDIKRRYYIHKLLDIVKFKYYHSNCLLNSTIYDSKDNKLLDKEIFCKIIPLLEPLYFIKNNYNNLIHRNPLLPSNYNANTFEKINNMNNTAYIDTFFSYICSELTEKDILPCFSKYYGSVNGIMKKYNFDISEEYHDFKEEAWFHKNLGEQFKMDIYMDSDDSDDSEGDNDYISVIKHIPCQLFFIEKLDGLLSELLDNFNGKIILSCLFQLSYALAYLQKHFQFTHNDLHIDNIMYQRTDKTYLYYKFNNIYFKVPTFGYIFKIIDFGRAIFTFKNKLFFSDCFSNYGEADGQYKYPIDTFLYKKDDGECDAKPNYNFDMCRLAITILDELNYDKDNDYKEYQNIIDYIYSFTLGKNNCELYYLQDNFDMYISIAKYANNCLPINIIQNVIFKEFRIKKKNFPKRFSYHF
jgi:hypothetical protein